MDPDDWPRHYLTPRERFSYLKRGIISFIYEFIDNSVPCRSEDGNWYTSHLDFNERLEIFWSCFDTFLRGYVYRYVP